MNLTYHSRKDTSNGLLARGRSRMKLPGKVHSFSCHPGPPIRVNSPGKESVISPRGKPAWPIRMSIATLALLGILLTIGTCMSRSEGASHPTLYFISSDLNQLRAKGTQGLGSEFRKLLLNTAELSLKTEIPREPRGRGSKVDATGTFNQEGIASDKMFFQAGRAIQAILPVLGLSYHLTGDRAYARRAVEWLDRYSQWGAVLREKPDLPGAAILNGLVIGYDLFYQELSPAQREQLLKFISALTQKFVKKVAHLSREPLPGNRAMIANNHNIVPACAAGMGALLLKIEGADDGKMLRAVVDCFHKVILPSGFSPQGEYVDGSEQWLLFVAQEMTLFFEALKRNGGPNFWDLPNVRAMPEFIIQANSLCAEDSPLDYRWRYVLLAMAAAYRDPEIQGLAFRPGFTAGPGRRIAALSATDDLEGEDSDSIWTPSAWEYLFYDPTLQPAPLRPRPLSVLFPHLGRVIMRSSWKKDASILTFRAGPRVGKEEGDNNAFQLTGYGVQLLPKLKPPFWPLEKRGREWHLERDWILGTKGNNTIMVDGVRQYSTLDPRFTGVNRRKAPPSDWLSTPDEGIPPTARILSFVTSPVADYAAGEAANAYIEESGRPLLDRFSRHLFFVKDEYLLVVDEIRGAGGRPRNLEWIFHAGKDNDLQLREEGFLISPRRGSRNVTLHGKVMVPDAVMNIERVPTRDESYRSPYVSIRQSSPQTMVNAFFFLEIRRGSDRPKEFRVVRDDEAATILSLGKDIFLFNKTAGSIQHDGLELRGRMAWVRPGIGAILVEGTRLGWKGKSLIEEPTPASKAWVGR